MFYKIENTLKYTIDIISLEPNVKITESFRKAIVDAALTNGSGGAYRLVFDDNTKS